MWQGASSSGWFDKLGLQNSQSLTEQKAEKVDVGTKLF